MKHENAFVKWNVDLVNDHTVAWYLTTQAALVLVTYVSLKEIYTQPTLDEMTSEDAMRKELIKKRLAKLGICSVIGSIAFLQYIADQSDVTALHSLIRKMRK